MMMVMIMKTRLLLMYENVCDEYNDDIFGD